MAAKDRMDLTEGSILPKVFLFAIPILLSSLLQQLFNSADTAVVGRFAGPFALAAVGSNSSIINLLVNFFTGLSVGANVIIANLIGRREEDKARRAVPTVMVVSVLSGFALTIIGTVLARPLLEAVDTPEEILPLAELYLRIYFTGMPFIMLFNFGSAVLRSDGNTRGPLYALALAGVVNVLLNLFFVIVLQMSVAGVALATVLSNAISGTIVFVMLLKNKGAVRLETKNFRFDFRVLSDMFRIGMPAGMQGVLFSVSNVVILSAVNSFGAYASSGTAAAMNFEHMSYFVMSAFAQAAVTFTSQNYGAGKTRRCREIYIKTLVAGLLVTFLFNMTIVLFRYPLLGIFTSDKEALAFAAQRILIITSTQALVVTYEVSGGCLRGLGKSMVPALLTLVFCCGFRLFWVYFILPFHRTYAFMLVVYPLSWILAGSAVTAAYLSMRKKIFSLVE